MAFAAKGLLVFVTLVCLASMGGAMLVAAPVLVPLHVIAARGSGPTATGGWAFLSGLSLFEFGWMWTYVATGQEGVSLAVGVVAGVGAVAVLLRRSADRYWSGVA